MLTFFSTMLVAGAFGQAPYQSRAAALATVAVILLNVMSR